MARWKDGTIRVLTSNDLLSGGVIFLQADGSWSPALETARTAETEAEAGELEALATREDVAVKTAGAYVIDVERTETGTLRPVHHREAIRTQGPSIRTDLGRQAEARIGGDHVSL